MTNPTQALKDAAANAAHTAIGFSVLAARQANIAYHEQIKPVADQAAARLEPIVDQAKTKVGPSLETAKAKMAPKIEVAKAKMAPSVDSVVAIMTPVVDQAKAKLAPLVDRARVAAGDASNDETVPTPNESDVASAQSQSPTTGDVAKDTEA